MNAKQAVIATAAAVLIALACDVPAGSDQGDSAGDNQPGGACTVPAAGGGAPAAKLDDGQFVYDLYVELWDENCNSAAMVDEGGAADGHTIPPLHVYVEGHITDSNGVSQPADFLGESQHEKDVNAPYHLRAFVAPRSAPHDVLIIGTVNRGARSWVGEGLPDGFIHCRITRDNAQIKVAQGSRDRVTHTVALSGGAGQVSCHLTVGVG